MRIIIGFLVNWLLHVSIVVDSLLFLVNALLIIVLVGPAFTEVSNRVFNI
jgi:hypothetical protein